MEGVGDSVSLMNRRSNYSTYYHIKNMKLFTGSQLRCTDTRLIHVVAL